MPRRIRRAVRPSSAKRGVVEALREGQGQGPGPGQGRLRAGLGLPTPTTLRIVSVDDMKHFYQWSGDQLMIHIIPKSL